MSNGKNASTSKQTQQPKQTTSKPQNNGKDSQDSAIPKTIVGKKPHGSRVIKSGG